MIAWWLSNTVDGSSCLEMLEEALALGRPEVFNTDQGVQFTDQAWTGWLEAAGRDQECPGEQGQGGRDVGKRSSPGPYLRKTLFWS